MKNQDSMGKTNFFLSTLPLSAWAILATWLHLEDPQKIQENELNTRFEQNFTMGSYGVGIRRAWCSQKACEICSSLVQKKILNSFLLLYTQAAQIAIDQFLVSRNFRG
jgi:hypothetical protein